MRCFRHYVRWLWQTLQSHVIFLTFKVDSSLSGLLSFQSHLFRSIHWWTFSWCLIKYKLNLKSILLFMCTALYKVIMTAKAFCFSRRHLLCIDLQQYYFVCLGFISVCLSHLFCVILHLLCLSFTFFHPICPLIVHLIFIIMSLSSISIYCSPQIRILYMLYSVFLGVFCLPFFVQTQSLLIRGQMVVQSCNWDSSLPGGLHVSSQTTSRGEK